MSAQRSEFCLPDGTITIVDKADLSFIQKYKWHTVSGSHSHYVQGCINGTMIFLHVLLMRPPNGLVVDHIDRNGLHNWRDNLRICTQSQNLAARGLQKNNTTGYRGVCYVKRRNKWQASIRYNKKGIFIGYFSTAIEAAIAYDKFAKSLYGEFAYLNFPEENHVGST